MKRTKYYWIKERHNPQLGVYYVACGQMSKSAARKMESPIYGCNIMRPFGSEKEYKAHLDHLLSKGERVQ